MSWLQLHDEIWPVTKDGAELGVFIRAPDVNCPRVSWDLTVDHYVFKEPPPAEGLGIERWLNIEIEGLILNLRDWRQFSGLEICANPAWHATQEFIVPYGGSYNSPKVKVSRVVLRNTEDPKNNQAVRTKWIGHDFMLRFGNRDGWSFSCELEGWLIPEEQYYRKTPEKPEELACFAQGAPHLRVVTRATFLRGTIELTRAAAADPIAHARKIAREEIGYDEFVEPKAEWHLRQTPDFEKIVPMPGWRSYVQFDTLGAAR
jgi:hypothetical protein